MVGNPLEYAFWAGAPAEAPTSYQALLTRRKIAESLLGKRSPFPTTLGEGLTYAGERFADTMRMKDLDERESAQALRDQRAMVGPLGIPTGDAAPVPGASAPVAAAPAAAEPSPIPSHLIGAKPVQTTREAPLAPPPAPALPDLPPSPGPRQQFGEAVPQAPNGSPDLPVRDSIAAAMVPLPPLQPTGALPAPGAPEVPSEVPLPLPRPDEAPPPPRNALPDASSPAPELGVLQQQSGVRRMPLAAPLERQLQTAAAQAGLGVEVNSGGQPSYGPNRIGSHRHDAGAAADLRLFERTEDGGKRYLSQNNPADRARMADFVRASVAAGATGVGSGPGYMGESGIHIGGGTPAVWGAGGRSANAPEWLRAAYQGGATGTPDAARANAGPTGGPTPADNPPIVTAQIKQMPGSVAPFAPPGSNFFQPDSMVGGSTGGASPTQIRPAPPAVAPNMAGSAVPPPLKPYDPGPEPARPTPTREMQYWKGVADNQSLSDDVRIRAQKKYDDDSKHLSEDYVRRWSLWKTEEIKSRDPATVLDLRSKQLTAEKAARDLEGEGFLPLTPDEAKTFPNLPPGVTAYKNRRGEVKFSPTPPASTTVTVDQRAENEEAKVSGKLAAEHMGETMKAASTAGNSLYTINRAKSLLDKIDTGALAPASLSVGAFARSLGVSDDALKSIGLKPDMIGKRQAFDAIVGELVIGKIGVGGFPANNFSNTDRTFLQNTVASLGSDPESNRIKLDAMHLVARRDIEKANEWAAFRNKPENKGKGFFDFQHQWDQKIQQQDLTGELQKRADNLLANAAGNIPQEAIKMLRNNPSSADKFDRIFGEGASKRYLGQ